MVQSLKSTLNIVVGVVVVVVENIDL